MIYNYLLVQFVFSILVILNFNKISKKIKIMSYNKNNLIQKKNISSFGSIFFLFTLIIIFFDFFYKKIFFTNFFFSSYREFYFFFITLFCIFLIGLYDDKYSSSPLNRLILFSIVIYFNTLINSDSILIVIDIKSINYYLPLFKLSVPLTILGIIIFLNAINFIDGINLNLSIFAFFILIFFILSNYNFNLNLFILISFLFFSYLNFKNKIYFGNAGVYVFSFFLVYQLLISHNKLIFNFETCLTIIFLPLIDMIRVVFIRIYNGKSPFLGDLNHLHHLMFFKYGSNRAVLLMILYYLFLLLIYFIVKLPFNLLFIFFLTIFYVLFIFYLKRN